MKRVRSLLASAAALLVVSSAVAVAQIRPQMGRGPALERLEQYKKIRMMEVMNMDEETSIRFFARYDKHQQILRDLRKKQADVLQQVQGLRRSNAEDGEYDKVIRELLSLEEQFNEAKVKFINELSDVLTKRQLAEYIVFEWRFQQNLRQLLTEIQNERGPGPKR